MRPIVLMSGVWVAGVWACVGSMGIPALAEAVTPPPAVNELKEASAAYAAAFNAGDYAALGNQWTERAELIEGGSRLVGRSAIVDSIKAWRGRHPESTLQVELRDVELVAEPLARVAGVMRFSRAPGEKPVESRFTGVRVKEGDTWRLTESKVTPAHVAALDDLDWMLGTWRGEIVGRSTVEIHYERALGGYAIVGRTTITPKPGVAAVLKDGIESMEIIHADRDAGLIRAWVFDSTGARGEGHFESDGVSFEKVMTGTPSDAVSGKVARWVQVISPTGEGRATTHMVERSIDGVPLPDAEPIHFKKVP